MSLGGDEIDQGSISASLGKTFERATQVLEDTLRIATGGGTADEENTLPAPKWDTYETKIAKFFNGGWFLLDDDVSIVTTIFDTVEDNIQRKVANDVMKAAGLVLAIDNRVQAEGECTGTGHLWRQVGPDWRCLHLMRKAPPLNFEEVDDDVYQSMDKYGLGATDTFYTSLLDCAMNGGEDKDIDAGQLVTGQIPTCFFNLDVFVILSSYCDLEKPPTDCETVLFDQFRP